MWQHYAISSFSLPLLLSLFVSLSHSLCMCLANVAFKWMYRYFYGTMLMPVHAANVLLMSYVRHTRSRIMCVYV